MNAIKDSIKSGRTVVGTAGAPNVDVSILADAGYDFLLFDTQHSPWEIKQLQPSIQAMRGKQAAPLVRVAANQAYQICFALDAGARGIVVPMVNTRAEAEAVVRACRYYPLGSRSNAGVRGEWGEFKNYRDYLDTVCQSALNFDPRSACNIDPGGGSSMESIGGTRASWSDRRESDVAMRGG